MILRQPPAPPEPPPLREVHPAGFETEASKERTREWYKRMGRPVPEHLEVKPLSLWRGLQALLRRINL